MAVVPDSHCNEWATGTETPSMVPTHQHSHWNLTLSYHQNVAGKGEPIRLALNHAGIPFTDVGHLYFHCTAPHVALFQEHWRSPHSPPYCARTLHLYRPHPPPRALPVCCLSHAPEVPGPAIVCSIARSSLSLLTLLICIRRRPLQHRFASRDEFTAMKEDGRLKFGQVPALAVTTGGKTTIINQRWVGRVRVVCVCVCVRRCSVHSPEVGAIIRRV